MIARIIILPKDMYDDRRKIGHDVSLVVDQPGIFAVLYCIIPSHIHGYAGEDSGGFLARSRNVFYSDSKDISIVFVLCYVLKCDGYGRCV